MATVIDETKIGTPTSANGLTLCNGVSLIPPIPNIPLGYQTGPSGQWKADHHFSKYHAIRAEASYAVGVYAGLCGPSYAVGFKAEGEVEGDVLTLAITEDEAMAGIFLGAGMGVEFTLGIEYFKVFTHHFVPRWGLRAGPKIEIQMNVDAIKAGVDLIAALLQVEDLLPKATTALATDLAGTPLAMIGEASDAYALNNGALQLDCIYSIPFNLWAIIVVAALAGEAIPAVNVATTAILAVHEALDVTLSEIGFGPSIGVDIPVLLQIEDVTIDDVKFTNTEITADGKWKGQKANPEAVLSDTPGEIAFNMVHNCGVGFNVGLFVEIQILELFHVGASADIGLMGIFNLAPYSGGRVYHTLKNTIGQDYLAAGCDCDDLLQKQGLVDVEFL